MAQEAFQKGYEDYFGAADTLILPETDIDQSLAAGGSAAYKAVVVILLVVLSAPVVREKLSSMKKAPAKAAKEVS